jgi:hypothetical protein
LCRTGEGNIRFCAVQETDAGDAAIVAVCLLTIVNNLTIVAVCLLTIVNNLRIFTNK